MSQIVQIDTEQIIEEVRTRPMLYDLSMSDHSRSSRDASWEEVFRALVPNWDQLDRYKKDHVAQHVQRRWKSLKDCVRRELKLKQHKKVGGKVIRKRKYIYFDQLSFLIPHLNKKNLASTGNSSGDEQDAPDESKAEIEVEYPNVKTEAVSDDSNLVDPTNYELEDNGDQVPLGQTKAVGNEDSDDDKHFLLSMLPFMKMFKEEDKLALRIQLMRAVVTMRQEVSQRNVNGGPV